MSTLYSNYFFKERIHNFMMWLSSTVPKICIRYVLQAVKKTEVLRTMVKKQGEEGLYSYLKIITKSIFPKPKITVGIKCSRFYSPSLQ